MLIKEFANRNFFGETLSSSSFNHKLTGQMRWRARFERAQYDRFIERVSGYNLPVIEYTHREGLALGMGSEIGLEAKRVDDGDKGFDGVKRRARLWKVLGHVATTTGEDGVDSGDAIGWSLDFG